MQQIVLATNNSGKLREIQAMLQPLSLAVVSQAELSIPQAAETAPTFVENALIKARNAAQYAGMPALADDSGLVVDVLDGAPGIYSARYAGENCDSAANVEKILTELRNVPIEQRTARFYCSMVYLRSPTDPVPIISAGSWEGRILLVPQGKNGFGYDPIFFVPEYDCSAAELAPELKNKISHRGQALRKLVIEIGVK